MSASGGIAPSSNTPDPTQTQRQASSGIVANASAVATLGGAAGVTTYISGFEVTAAGSTAGAVVDVTVTGPLVSMHFTFVFPAGATTAAQNLVVEFPEPIPAAAVNTAIVVTCPAGGAGNTNTTVNAHGFRA